MWHVYILFSRKTGRTYVGYSNDINKRVQRHNAGEVKSTKQGVPWELMYKEEFTSISDANKKEKYYKSGAGRRKLKKIYTEFVGRVRHAH